MSGNKSLAGAIGEVKKAEKTAPVKETEYKAGTKDFFDQFEEKPAIKKPKKDRRLEIRVNSELYDKFSAICAKKQTSAYAMLNVLMAEFVEQNEK